MDDRQHQYVAEVMRFRKALNLTSISDPQLFIKQFILPSLALGQWLPDSGRLLDIGSGMGIPGIPLLISKPALQGVLVERRKKRAEFLRHVVRKMSLNAVIFDDDINDLDHLGIDACVARAVTEQEELLTMCGRHANIGAIAVLPVPSNSKPVSIKEWRLENERRLNEFGDQLVRCYRFC
ncbi:MAG TPA: RsmG family class I SAM-dependent methyltransferase [Mariprofundaceae bacterium]|nr:RsmG family class I SAM-dependent methyltransferase [Mariprofundaceae bacterium]